MHPRRITGATAATKGTSPIALIISTIVAYATDRAGSGTSPAMRLASSLKCGSNAGAARCPATATSLGSSSAHASNTTAAVSDSANSSSSSPPKSISSCTSSWQAALPCRMDKHREDRFSMCCPAWRRAIPEHVPELSTNVETPMRLKSSPSLSPTLWITAAAASIAAATASRSSSSVRDRCVAFRLASTVANAGDESGSVPDECGDARKAHCAIRASAACACARTASCMWSVMALIVSVNFGRYGRNETGQYSAYEATARHAAAFSSTTPENTE
mmetsp:Transcript_9273/g.34610  ORF Transcript_9273/g.34610 Transcript_9273/m.34610 type:complete len:275 (+) Transcript_9273:2093-2917(+)